MSQSQGPDVFKVRIFTCDHYLGKPINGLDELYSQFNGCETSRVPVIRVFGVTESGEKVCLHVHGVYPYFCIPFEAERHIDKNSFIRKLADEIDQKLSTNSNSAHFGNKRSSSHIHKIEIIKAIPFYGYHSTEESFLKLSFYNPFSAKKVIELITQKKIMNREIQPYYAHIPYILQFFIDFNLNGMNFLNVREVRHRGDSAIGVTGESKLTKLTCCDIEVDCKASHILNASESSINTGLDLIWEEERERCRRTGNPSQLSLPASQERPNLDYFYREGQYQKQIDELLASLNDSDFTETSYVTDSAGSRLSQSLSQEYDIDDFVNVAQGLIDKRTEESVEDEFDEDDELMTAEMSQMLRDVVNHPSDIEESPVKSKPPRVSSPQPSGSTNVEMECSPFKAPNVVSEDLMKLLSEDDLRWAVESDEDLDRMLMCECSHDQCCDICCDRSSDHCECDCQDGDCSAKCGKLIPQVDGADDLSSDSDSSLKELSQRRKVLKVDCQHRTRRRVGDKVLKLDSSLSVSDIRKMMNASVTLEALPLGDIAKYSSKSQAERNRVSHLLSLCRPLTVCIPQEEIESAIALSKFQDSSQVRFENESQALPPTQAVQQHRMNEECSILAPQEVEERAELPDSTTQVEEQRALELMKRHWDKADNSDLSTNGIYSFYDFGSDASQKSIDLSSLDCSQPRKCPLDPFTQLSQSPIVGSQHAAGSSKRKKLYRFCTSKQAALLGRATPSPDFDRMRSSTPRVPKKSARSKKRLSVGDISAIEVSQPLATINEEAMSAMTKVNSQGVKLHRISKYTSSTTMFDPNQCEEEEEVNLENVDIYCDSFIEGPTRSTYDFAVPSLGDSVTEDKKHCSPHEFQKIVTMSMELHTDTRGDLKPDPKHDGIRAIFFSTVRDEPLPTSGKPQFLSGILLVHDDKLDQSGYLANKSERQLLARSGYNKENLHVGYALDETDLILRFIQVVRLYDPEIILGYETEMLSWGYLIARASVLNLKITTGLSRLVDESYQSQNQSDDFGLRLPGRIVVNFWRTLRHEITLNVYTYENCHYHVLHERIPAFSNKVLTQWYNDSSDLERWRLFVHYMRRVEGSLRMVMKLGLISKTSTLARVYGIQFEEVFTRGSQFRVESMMLRYLKKFNYIPLSPSIQQRKFMRAPEWIPLVMEPESNFYTDPVVVLDFQSLYPSMVIAYNMCYSTCLGRVANFKEDVPFQFGCSMYYLPKSVLRQHRDNIFVSANGVAFLKKNVRRGILPQMLEEILTTRIMVKNVIKENKKSATKSKSLDKLLDARQLALKLIANVTYGYTAANFSGRMPCVDLADAIVSKGRETLERSIELIHSNKAWNAKVVYGDTDSVFVLFRGCSKEEAFRRGREIADEVTKVNPKPVKLKFEKVYYPCVLQSKKRYVGFAYEDENQQEPKFDAKGIETVRRDSVPAVSKMLEKSIRTLFTTKEINEVKKYVQRQFQKIITGKVSTLQDFIFAREYRGRERYSRNACVPALEITKKLLATDPRAEPRRGERVPYVIVAGSPNQPVFQLVKHPHELLENPSLKLNSVYYIERVIIPPLNRIFMLIGEDLMKWYEEMPKKKIIQRAHYLYAQQAKAKKQQTTISQYFISGRCPVCESKSLNGGLCNECTKKCPETGTVLTEKVRRLENKFCGVRKICSSCSGSPNLEQLCSSIDCPILFRYNQAKMDTMNIDYYRQLMERLKF
ncbi:DNA polymerase zeta catalytic subunit [Halotydeus destructor]|nr:DNA polymerase zeta catalytic subunit [Halotydeus destructor]